MYVSKTITIDLKYLVKIEKAVESGKAPNASKFIQKAIYNELENLRDD